MSRTRDGIEALAPDQASLGAAETGRALAIEPSRADGLMPLLGLVDLGLAAAWNGRAAHVLALSTPLGLWQEGR